MKCQKCLNEKKVVFRTTPIGNESAMWNCIECIKGCNTEIPKPDSDLLLLINDLVQINENNWIGK